VIPVFFSLSAKVVRHALVLLLPVLLLSCSSLPELTTTEPVDWPDTLEHRQQISSWKIQGKLGVQTEDNGGSLDLFWNQAVENYSIRLIAPMGQGTILIRGHAQGVHVKTADGEQYAEDADALLASNLGVNMPVKGLRDWLRGVPMKDKTIVRQSWDKNGQLYKLVQDGWNVEMSNYKKVGEHQLPHDFFLGRDDRPELGIRLLIRRWTISDGPAVQGAA
jgi:outer membrane lipoprotein LolB